MESEGYRKKYEFSSHTKKQVRKEQKNRCAVTGKKEYVEIHHLLGVALAHGWFPTVNPSIFSQRENAVAVNPEDHKLIHEQIRGWDKEFLKLYVIGLYKYLRDIHKEKEKRADLLRPDKMRRII